MTSIRSAIVLGSVAALVLSLTGCPRKDDPAPGGGSASSTAAAPPKGAPPSLTLTGKEEVPDFDSSGAGVATVAVTGAGDDATVTLAVTVTKAPNSKITGVAIHLGARGANGPVAFAVEQVPAAPGKTFKKADLKPTAGEPFAKVVEDIKAGKAYVQVTTADNSTGEMRAQIRL